MLREKLRWQQHGVVFTKFRSDDFSGKHFLNKNASLTKKLAKASKT